LYPQAHVRAEFIKVLKNGNAGAKIDV
jgi:hypothetical protein